MDDSNDILLAKWLSGEISKEERVQLARDYDLDALTSILEQQEQFLPETIDSEVIWTEINTQRNEDVLAERSDREIKDTPSKWIRNTIIFLIILVGLAFLTKVIVGLKTSNSILETKETKITNQLFTDGSRAIVGPHSTLKYDENSWSEARSLELKGQAFFEVNKGTPFIVSTEAGKVEVLGTQFDVWNINPSYMRVACSEGRVRVTDRHEVSLEIIQGQYVYIVNGNIQEIRSGAGDLGDWRQNFRNYETTPMGIVLQDLERFYSVSFSWDDSISEDLFSGILPTNDLTKCVQYIETSLSYNSRREENEIVFEKSN